MFSRLLRMYCLLLFDPYASLKQRCARLLYVFAVHPALLLEECIGGFKYLLNLTFKSDYKPMLQR
eukprot:6456593-Amphidinium_carterae.2